MTRLFKEQISEKLKGLSRKSICAFAWICAVRVLPYIGTRGDLDYWDRNNKDKRQEYLLRVFRALDAIVVANAHVVHPSGIQEAADAAADAAKDVETMADAYRIPKYEASLVVAGYVNVAREIKFAANAITAIAAAAYTNTSSNVASTIEAASVVAMATTQHGIGFESLLLQDLDEIKAGTCRFQHNSTIYEGVLDCFFRAMQNLNCRYWGDWYERLFEKGFILDNEDMAEIELRLNVPGEILELGAAEVARYIKDLKHQGAARLNETRVLILGEKGAGKTSLALRLKNPPHPMPKVEDSTEGVDIINWNVPSDLNDPKGEVNAHIWDFAGHVITHAVHRCFMSERCLYILVINGRTEGDQRIDYWLEQIRYYGGDSPVLVFTNIYDEHRVDVPENSLKKSFPSILGFYQGNIGKIDDDFEKFRQLVMRFIRDNPLWANQKMPALAYNVKEALQARFVDGNDYISHQEFDLIADENCIAYDKRRQLLEDLRALGICLCYDVGDIAEFDTMVLNPRWISYGIYRLINWGVSLNKYILSVSDYLKIFTREDSMRYPKEKAAFLFRLMNTYQLAFHMDRERIFVPLLLPADRPKPELIPYFPFGERLRMEYRADYSLPPYTVARLAVLHSEELNPRSSWRFGILLEWENTYALVEEDSRCRSITVSVMGAKKTEYITRLRGSLESILNDYKSDMPKLKLEIILFDERLNFANMQLLYSDDKNSFLVSEVQIIGNAAAGQKLVIDHPNLPLINPEPTIQAYNLIINNRKLYIYEPESNVIIGGDFTDNHSRHVNLGFKDCAINFQANIGFFARNFRKNNCAKLADDLVMLASDLDEIVIMIPMNSVQNSEDFEFVKASILKKGLLNRLKILYGDLCDENSVLRRNATKIRSGVKMLQKLGSNYNDMSQWFDLPQIPKQLLKEFEVNGGETNA